MIGLSSNTTYAIKVKAVQTKYTETEYSLEATASTVSPTLSFDLDISATDSESSAPYTLAIGSLSTSSVTTASEKIWVDLETNAAGGAFVYIYSLSTGLSSLKAGYTITSATTNLATAQEGYGLQVSSLNQSSGGPFLAVNPYDGSLENIGILDTTSRNILSSSGVPITAGRASIFVKAKASALTPSASDYTDTITIIASGTF